MTKEPDSLSSFMRLAIGLFSVITVFWSSSLLSARAQDSRPAMTLVLAQDDSIAILQQIFDFLRLYPAATFPRLAAHEPGPLELREGLRLLPNEVAPRLSVPATLVFSGQAAAEVDVAMLALIRRCLLDGGQVWVIGNAFPQPLLDLPLDPGQEIRLVPLVGLAAALYARANEPP